MGGEERRRKRGKWWPNSDSNQGHADFQSAALPTELLGHLVQLASDEARCGAHN